MKKSIRIILICLMSLIGNIANAHDFNAVNEGKTIYYVITSSADKTVAVSYRGSSASSYSNEYSGSISIPESVTYNSVKYSVTSIGGSAFSGCSGLTSITIPNSVTSIGDCAFDGCSGLTSITIPNSVTSIGGYAFFYCPGLTSVTIPNSVTSIGEWAFSECSGLKSVTIGNSVTSIGEWAFENCSRLTSITIPNSVTSIGDFAFGDCNITDVNVNIVDFANNNNIPSYFSSQSFNYYYQGKKLESNIILPDNIVSIGTRALYKNKSITSVTIPNSVTSIGDFAFAYCSGLTSVTIPNSVKSIGNYAFKKCSNLTSVTIGNSVTSIRSSPFDGCNNVKELIYAEGTTTLLRTDLTSITSVTIPNSVTSIGGCAFESCKGLTSVTIPNSVKSIGNYAFESCTGLTSVIIPNSVKSIGSSAFYHCSGLTSITIPNSVTSIGDNAFQDCSGLTSISIPNSVTSIGEKAFYDCKFTSSEFINNSSLDEVQNNYWGAYIYDVIQEDGLCIIDDVAVSFRGKSTSVVIPNSVTSIGEYAFYGCKGLTSVAIGKSVTSIGNDAFYGCKGLTSITIPNSVTSIGYYAFYGCSNLRDMYVNWEKPLSINNDALGNLAKEKMTLHVPIGTKNLYKACNVWKYFGTIMTFQSLSMDNIKSWKDTQKDVNIYVDNDVTISNVQFDLQLPDGVEIATEEYEDEEPEYMIAKGGRTKSGHSISCSKLTNGDYRIICYSTTNATLRDTDKSLPLMTITLQISNSAQNGIHGIIMKNITLAHTEDNVTTPYTSPLTDSQLNIPLTHHLSLDYNANLGSVALSGETYDQTVSLAEHGDTITLTASPKPRQKFLRWTESGKEVSKENPYTFVLNSDMNIVAEFESAEFNMKFMVDGEEYSSSVQLYGEKLAVPSVNPSKTGYTFVGWEGVNKSTLVPDCDKSFNAVFSANPYTITFVSDGQVVSSGVQYYGNALNLPSNPTKVGYTFIGWDGVTSSTKVPASDFTYNALYKINQYNVTFVAEGKVVKSVVQDYMSAISLPEAPDKPKYVFITWGDVSTVPAKDVTYTAQYSLLGDIYEDGTINITDLTELVNMIMTRNFSDLRKTKVADVYKDNNINVTDLTSIVNMIMNSTSEAKGRESSFGHEVATISAECRVLQAGNNGLMGISIFNGSNDVSNIQFDLVLPDGVTMSENEIVESITATDRLTSDHMISACEVEEGKFRVLIYSFQNAKIKGTDGNVVTIALNTEGLMSDGEYDVELNDVSLVRPTSEPIEYDHIDCKMYIGKATGVSQTTSEVRSEESRGRNYNLGGQSVGNGYKGIIISNGKKKINK